MFDELSGDHSRDAPAGTSSAREQRISVTPSGSDKTTSDLSYPQRLVPQSSQARNFWINHALPLCGFPQHRYRYYVTILKDFQGESCRRIAELREGVGLWDYVAYTPRLGISAA
jgi:hypothetical protein